MRSIINKLRDDTTTIKILSVAEFNNGYTIDYDHDLGLVFNSLANTTPSSVNIIVDKVHRNSKEYAEGIRGGIATKADKHDFYFAEKPTDHLQLGILGEYSQIWLFGKLLMQLGRDQEYVEPKLEEHERHRIIDFMENGGGVFATGDHEDLGWTLCGSIPRVRFMRRWWWHTSLNEAPPPGYRRAPDSKAYDDSPGWNVHNTLNIPDSIGSQSDQFPQRIFPVTFVRNGQPSPHPLLSIPAGGSIQWMPDHMHEGWCDVPSDLDIDLAHGETRLPNCMYSWRDFPQLPDGYRESPKVIAHGERFGGNRFEMISAYNGHTVQKGRVACDSSWHHWINMNLRGMVEVANRNPDVKQQWDAIQQYYLNMSFWLSPPYIQEQLRERAFARAVFDAEVQSQFRPIDHIPNHVGYFHHLGTHSLLALAKEALPWQVQQWIADLLDGCIDIHPDRSDTLSSSDLQLIKMLNYHELRAISLGGAFHAIIHAMRTNKYHDNSFDLFTLSKRGALMALSPLLQQVHAIGVRAAEVLKSMHS